MDEEQETEVFLCDEPLPHSEEPEPFEVLEETAEGDQSEQSDEEDSSDLLEGCTRIMTRREERCLLAQQKAWTKSQGSVTVAELFSPPHFTAAVENRGKEDWLSTSSKAGISPNPACRMKSTDS